MISLLAASILWIGPNQSQDAWTSKVYAQVTPSVVRLAGAGYAALIDDRGLFIAHNSLVQSGQLRAAWGRGTLTLDRIYVDEPSQLCLLEAQEWSRDRGSALHVARQARTGRIVAVTEAGPIAGDLADLNRAGLIRPSNRYLPLSEIRIETQSSRLAGALLFSDRGELIGLLGATQDQSVPMAFAAQANFGGNTGQGSQNQGGQGGNVKAKPRQNSFGPSGLTVAYSISPKVLCRVVDGFLSPTRRPTHPSLGIQFKDSSPGEVTVVQVNPLSPASDAHVQLGDVIKAVDSQPITSSVRLAAILFEHNPGDRIKLTVMRNGEVVQLSAVIGVLD